MTRSQPPLKAATLTLCGVLLAASALAQDNGVIRAGIDLWNTPSDGSTYVQVDLPKDFFCPGSAPVGKIFLRGEPLETDPPTALGDTDTIIQRLEDTAPGGSVPIQVQALCLKGADTLRIECEQGLTTWEVSVSLDGEQPVSEIHIEQDTETGGFFDGEVHVNALIQFTETGQNADIEPPDERGITFQAPGRVLEVSDQIAFASSKTPWVYDPGVEGVRYESELAVGTSCGAAPVRFLPGTSNFHPGWGQGTQAQRDAKKCKCHCKCGSFCRLPVREQALLAQHGVTPPCRRCTCL